MNRIVLATLILLNAIVGSSQKLSLEWETDSLFLKPESGLYDSLNKVIYISNINGNYLARDGNGFISRLTLDGKIKDLQWCSGLDNPQGMGLANGKLYVADIDRVVKINVSNASIEKEYKIAGTEFLNDITADKNGDIYVSDCRKNKIYRIANDKVELWTEDPVLSAPNGLLCTGNSLFILNMGRGEVFIGDKAGKKLTFFAMASVIATESSVMEATGILSQVPGRDRFFI